MHLKSDLSNNLDKNILPNETVTGVVKDGQDNLWFSTLTSGVFLLQNVDNIKEKTNWIIKTEAQKIATYDDSSLIFGNRFGLYFTQKNIVKKIYSENTNIVGDLKIINGKTPIWAAATNNVWNAVLNKVYPKTNFFEQKVIKLNASTKLEFLCDSSIVIVSPSGLMFYPQKIDYENLTNDRIKEIYKNDKNSKEFKDKFTIIKFDSIFVKNISILDCDNILMGTLDNLYKYNISYNKASIYIPQTNIFKKGIAYIVPFKKDYQAVAIRFGGLALIKDTSVLTTITELDGLLDNSITYILPDSNKLWLASNKGLSCITFQSLSPVKYTIKNFGKEVGLGNEIIYQIIRFKKDILAATSKGIFKLANADSLLTVQSKPIPFYVTTISTYLGDTSNITSISLPYNKNRITINFDAIEFTTPTDIEYYYRIVNNDSTWYSISNPQLILQNLSPGTYSVEIKATLPKQGKSSEIKQLTISVEKPWWQKKIVLVAFALGLASLLYLFTNWRIKKAKKEAQEKNEIATKMLKLEQTALQAQMNPHFIFNCLTGIQQLMNSNNIDEANEYLVTFSRLIRKTLESSTQEFIVLQDEIDYLIQYISLEEKRLTTVLHTTFSIADNINTQTIEIPNMMLQPIVENAIRHGIKPLENKTAEITLAFTLIKNIIQCIIIDNGIGREASNQSKLATVSTHKSFGLSIIEQRLQGYSKSYKQDYSIKVIDLKNENNIALGTKVILQLPIKK
jgi:Histidine kinase/Y_Y_Y domain